MSMMRKGQYILEEKKMNQKERENKQREKD